MFGFKIFDIAIIALVLLFVGGAYWATAVTWKKKREDGRDLRCKTMAGVIILFLLLGGVTAVAAFFLLRIPVWEWLRYVIAAVAAVIIAFFGGSQVGEWVGAEKCPSCDKYARFRTGHEIDADVKSDPHGKESIIEHRTVVVRRCVRCGGKDALS